MTNHFNQLSKLLNTLGRRHNLSTVFNDLLTMAICSYHRTNIQSKLTVKDPDNETLYLDTIQKYDRDELNNFAKAMGHLHLQVHDNPYSDILGEYFTENITNGHNGQYFTPEPICTLMTQLHAGQGGVKDKTVLDPACGSARMLLAFAQSNPQNQFFGADVSQTCVKMATVNFFLNGLKGEVAWMNTLSMEFYGAWHVNTQGIGIVPIEKKQSRIWSNPPIANKDEPEEGAQLILF